MDNTSQRTLRRIELNDNKLTQIYLAGISSPGYAEFSSCLSGDYSRLGRAIAKNAQLVELKIDINNSSYEELETTNRQFYDGLKRNTSIKKLDINFRRHTIVDSVGHELLKTYQENGNQLTYLRIKDASQHGGDLVIAMTLQRCPILNTLILNECRIDTNYLTSIVEAVRGHSSLENLGLNSNIISSEDCSILAALLNDPNCNLHTLDIEDNNIGDQGATILANSLANNTKLRKLNLQYNAISLDCAQSVFSKIICNTTSIDNTYSSNHTLEHVLERPGEKLRSLFRLNKGTNKKQLAIEKILKYHPNIDMEPLYDWDSDGDWSLKALPHVIDWFEQAAEVDGGVAYVYHVDARKLSAIYQFVHDMPLLFIPSYHNKKQKKDPDAYKE